MGYINDIATNANEIEKLKNLWAPLYKQYENFFSFDILDKIKKA